MSDSFFDSNVLLYLMSGSPDRARLADHLVEGGGVINVQVLNEIASVSRRQFHMSWADTSRFVDRTARLLDVRPVTVGVHRDGLRIAERYGFALYDAFIVAAALEAGCDTLWSESMQDGMVVDSQLTITNPFSAGGAP